MFVYLLLAQTEENMSILESHGFHTEIAINWSKSLGKLFLYTEAPSAFKIGKYALDVMPGINPLMARIQIEPSQIPQIATLFNLGIYGEDLIPLLTGETNENT